MADDISDVSLASYLRRYMVRKNLFDDKLKSIRLCGSQLNYVSDLTHSVFLLSNQVDKSYFLGITHCHSPWACPVCSPKVMAKKGTDIACAIDALSTWYNEQAFMVTFTLPHSVGMPCERSFNLLTKVWRTFTKETGNEQRKYKLRSDIDKKNKTYTEGKTYYKRGNSYGGGTKNKTDQRAVGKLGEERIHHITHKGYGNFRETLGIKHFIKVYEVTYGENGWHPHIHALFWCPKDKFDQATSFQDELLDKWWATAKYHALKELNAWYPDRKEENAKSVDDFYADWRKYPKTGHRSVYFSCDKKGKLIVQKSSMYISGWSGNMELTGDVDVKKGREGHYTPFQMLEKARSNASQEQLWMPLFIEYVLATRGRRRVEFAKHSGLRKIIDKWKATNKYVEVCKKKALEKATGRFQVLCWFTSDEWYNLCHWEKTTDEDIMATILKLARAPDAFQLVYEFCLRFDVDISQHLYTVVKQGIVKRIEKNNYFNALLDEVA